MQLLMSLVTQMGGLAVVLFVYYFLPFGIQFNINKELLSQLTYFLNKVNTAGKKW